MLYAFCKISIQCIQIFKWFTIIGKKSYGFQGSGWVLKGFSTISYLLVGNVNKIMGNIFLFSFFV